jgi:hypothetical protein
MMTWAARCARMLWLELHAIACDALGVELDGGFGPAALAAITAAPGGPQRDYQVAAWARRIAAGHHKRLAFVISPETTEADIEVIKLLYHRVLVELGSLGALS